MTQARFDVIARNVARNQKDHREKHQQRCDMSGCNRRHPEDLGGQARDAVSMDDQNETNQRGDGHEAFEFFVAQR